jgi:hypothetical protein
MAAAGILNILMVLEPYSMAFGLSRVEERFG